MANTFKDRVIEGLRGFLWPDVRSKESGQAKALRLMYDGSNAGNNMVPGNWYGLHSTGTGIRTGVRWVCYCGHSYDLMDSEKYMDYRCNICKRPFDFAGWSGLRLSKNKQERSQQLARLVGIVSEADYIPGQSGDWLPPDQHEVVLRQVLKPLPSRARENNGPRVIDTWGSGFDGEFTYEQSDYAAKRGGF